MLCGLVDAHHLHIQLGLSSEVVPRLAILTARDMRGLRKSESTNGETDFQDRVSLGTDAQSGGDEKVLSSPHSLGCHLIRGRPSHRVQCRVQIVQEYGHRELRRSRMWCKESDIQPFQHSSIHPPQQMGMPSQYWHLTVLCISMIMSQD